MKKTLLIIPGLPRCATTSIVSMLNNHKDVFPSNIKEPHTLIPEARRSELYGFVRKKKVPFKKLGFVNSYSHYLRNFNYFKDDKVYIDASTLYSIHLGFMDQVKEISEKYQLTVKFLVGLRNPYDRAVSHYRFSISRGEEHRQFSEATCDELKGLSEDWLLGGYIRGGRYDELIRNLGESFGSDSVLTYNIDDDDIYSVEFQNKLLNFLGLSMIRLKLPEYENKSVVYQGKLAANIRYAMKRLRDYSPWLFDRPMTRAAFFRVMKIFGKLERTEVIVDLSREEFMEMYDGDL